MATFRPRELTIDDETGRMKLLVHDEDEADALAREIGVEHEDGFFALGRHDDGPPRWLDAGLEAEWDRLGRAYDAEVYERLDLTREPFDWRVSA